MAFTIHGDYFYGNKISDYGIENGYVDYRTLSKAFNAVLNNDIMAKTYDIGYWEPICGFEANEYDEYPDVFQWFIVDDNGARILEECEEVLFYNEELGMYLWGVTHYGTSWDYVLTDIKIERSEEK